jgi:hypothetical protein
MSVPGYERVGQCVRAEERVAHRATSVSGREGVSTSMSVRQYSMLVYERANGRV